MKKNILLLLASGTFIICGTLFYRYQAHTTTVLRIAILLPVTHPALEEIQHSFQEAFLLKGVAEFDVYNAQGDRVLLRSIAHDILAKNYDLVCTIATQPTLMVHQIFKEAACTTPIVGCAVDDPVKLGLIESAERSGGNTVIVSSQENIIEQMEALREQAIVYNKVLVIHAPSVNFEQATQQLRDYLKSEHKQLTQLEIQTVAELPIKCEALLPGHDLVVIFKDNVVVSALESVVRLCNAYHVPLYASDLNSLDKGATYAYGVHESAYGEEGGRVAQALLLDRQAAAQDFPLIFVTGHQFITHATAQES